MNWLPWILLFFFILFVGLFFVVFYSVRNQEKALDAIMRQQTSLRLELERLGDALDAVLDDRELEDRDFAPNPREKETAQKDNTRDTEAVPGLDRLLLGPDSRPESAARTGREARLPDLKF